MANTRHRASCVRCGPTLRAADSVARGYGPTCRARLAEAARVADLAELKPVQVERARELIEQGAIVTTSRSGVFRAVSSDGSTVYLATANGYTCPAGQKGRCCYHCAAVTILTTATPARRAA